MLVGWECDQDLDVHTWEVLNREGTRIAKFTDPGKSPILAQLMGHRVAIAHHLDIQIWSLLSGRLQGRIVLPPPEQPIDVYEWLYDRVKLATNSQRSKLAYCLSLQVIHVYDLSTLDLLGSFPFPQGLFAPHMVCDSLAWGVFGFSLLTGPRSSDMQDSNLHLKSCCTHLLKPGLDFAALNQVHWQPESTRQLPAASACGTFTCVCSLQQRLIDVKVYDVRSGRLIQHAELAHGIQPLAKLDRAPALSVIKVWWIPCGLCIMVHLAQLQHSRVVCQHVLCLQFSA